MRMVDLILKQRFTGALADDEIDYIIDEYVSGGVPDYQMSAMLMAICFTGLPDEATAHLTLKMARSGDVVDLCDLPGIKVDKHSTGGVGDTTTLVLAPLVAACGGTVAKMSGRGLGHTGGTLDKLESVKGVCVEQPIDRFKDIVRRIGVCVVGQSGNLVPADKALYALRDVTGTVESIPLIASSIMSKKIASGADAIVLDVKVGSGAFMRSVDDARILARTMVSIGESVGRRTVAFITDMNQPLGTAIGNGLEMREAIDVLAGRVPKDDPLYEVCMMLASDMLILGGQAGNEAEARQKLTAALESGAGLNKLSLMIEALGGDTDCISNPDVLCSVRERIPVTMGKAGFVSDMSAEEIGRAAQLLGAGRARKEDVLDPAVGLVMHKRRGDRIEAEEPVATLYVNSAGHLNDAADTLRGAINISETPPDEIPMIYDVVRGKR